MVKTIKDIFPDQIRLRSRWRRFPGVAGDCWEWIGKQCDAGYGIAFVDGKPKAAHRLSYVLSHGSISPGYEICHKCDVHCCCNPDHLFSALPEQNQLDRWKWKFVSKGKFIAGDYEEWRDWVLFRAFLPKAVLPEGQAWQAPSVTQVLMKTDKRYKLEFSRGVRSRKKNRRSRRRNI
jgi:hypothetical protein